MKTFLFLSIHLFIFFIGKSQSLSYTDPAIAYQRVLLEKGSEGTYQQIGNFKVIGTQFLFGDKLISTAYAGNQKSSNIKLGYNTFNQTVELYMSDNSFKIIKTASEIDSFTILNGNSEYIKEDLSFQSSKFLKSKLKDCFLQVIFAGPKFSLFKSYNSTLDYVSTNYIQSELRQFTVDFTYYYYDSALGQLKKIKLNRDKLLSEFKSVNNADNIVSEEAFSINPEKAAINIFKIANN
jgi:hypothetical protein